MVASTLKTSWTRTDKIVLALLTIVVCASLPFLVHPWYDPTQDGSLYLGLVRSIVAGEGYSQLGSVFHLRPPGFSYLLAPVFAAFPYDFLALNLYVSLWGALALLLIFLHQREIQGGVLSGCVCLLVWFNSSFRELSNQTMSDVPGLAMLFGCLLIDRWAARCPSILRYIVLGLAIGLAAYLRSTHLLLIPAIFISCLWRSTSRGRGLRAVWDAATWKRLLVAAILAWLVLLPWSLHKSGRIADPPADQVLAYDYATGMFHRDAGAPSSPRLGIGEILGRAGLRSRQIASVLGSGLREGVSGNDEPKDGRLTAHSCYALVLVGLLCVSLAQRRLPAELFALATLASLSIYFGFRERLLLPVYVIALCAAATVVRDALQRITGHGRATIATSALIVVAAALDANPRRDWESIEREYGRDKAYFRALEDAIGDDARIGIYKSQKTISVFLKRDVPIMRMAVRRAGDPAAMESMIRKYDLNTIVLREPSDTRKAATYLRKHYGAGVAVGESTFWRVRP